MLPIIKIKRICIGIRWLSLSYLVRVSFIILLRLPWTFTYHFVFWVYLKPSSFFPLLFSFLFRKQQNLYSQYKCEKILDSQVQNELSNTESIGICPPACLFLVSLCARKESTEALYPNLHCPEPQVTMGAFSSFSELQAPYL